MSIKHLFGHDGFSLTQGVREYKYCRQGLWGTHESVLESLRSAWSVARPVQWSDQKVKRDKRMANVRRHLLLTKCWVIYNNPLAVEWHDIWYDLANKGWVKHFDYTCPDNDLCEGH
jgi:hypothetical protein